VAAGAVSGSSPALVARAAVLGSPIAHSLSPALHLAGYRELGLADWSYEAIECDEHELPGFLDSLGPEWAGLSLTMPLKRAVLPLLDETERLALAVGAANTVLLRDGKRLGYNTDVPGMVAAMRAAGVTSGRNAVILGSGATASSALAALREIGAGESRSGEPGAGGSGAGESGSGELGPGEIAVAVRSLASAEPLLDVGARLGVDVRLLSLGGQPGSEADRVGDPEEGRVRGAKDGPLSAGRLSESRWKLLISTTPAAGARAIASQIETGEVRADVVFDAVYDPWPTALAAGAAAAGLTVISGYELLLHQAVGQFELMTGRAAPVAAMRAAGLAVLERRRNIR
jgi:shikimate dehydrogenase